MCGIIGYANYHHSLSVRDILNMLLHGLQKMEYRGYDSAGICIDRRYQKMTPPTETTHITSDAEDPNFTVIRSVGNIDQLSKKVFSPDLTPPVNMEESRVDHIGIAHTRWATHGEVCERNSHPQRSADGSFVVVHNGIMTNYMTVKQLLLSEGYTFSSDTDTEVICSLAEYIFKKNPKQSFSDLAGELTRFVQGAYAFLIKSVHFPDELIACRKGSPLVIGVKQMDEDGQWLRHHAFEAYIPDRPTQFFFASDYLAFAEHTSNIMYLEDDDFVHYKNGELHFFSSKKAGAALPREFEQLEMTLESLSKGNYDHFMLKEIYEQSESVVSTMRGRVDFSKNTAHLGGFTETNIRNVLSSRRILFISCGTSLNSCNAVRPLWEELIDIPVTVENASDFIDREPQIRRDDTCIFVSQSGETADTLTALKHCRAGGALCIGVTNVVGSSISRGTDFGAHLNAGVEVGVASTKAYTSQVVLMTVVALLLSRDSVSRQERRESIFIGLASLSKVISETLRDTFEPIKDVAKHLKDAKSVLVLGRGYDFSTCMEGALKIKELSYVHTEGINSGN
ncbi:glucosamine-fructose-6-phosphate aminotransferase [Angomonas deanei]|nr:glucosamine-fructose-6-phosphate aminotransferase [Angomonas deanei]|eukprot:EPY43857.1 glucosamine-fructose-6-phosphate aminotransferase [Angomonas deanei]